MLLIATQILRVASPQVGFAVEGDRVPMAISAVVLIRLARVFFLGKAG